MTTSNRFGDGDFYAWGPREEPTFKAREYFVDVLQNEVPNAYKDFKERLRPTFHEVFDVAWTSAPEFDGKAEDALRALFKLRGHSWGWPLQADDLRIRLEDLIKAGEPADWSTIKWGTPYMQAFDHWPPPTPTGTWGRMSVSVDEHQRIVSMWARSWYLLGGVLTTLLEDELTSWSKKWHLQGNEWVASHLLARRCKARLLEDEEARLDHVSFGIPWGMTVSFLDALAESFRDFLDWDPTGKQWGSWRKDAEDRFRQTVNTYKDRVQESCENPRNALRPTRPETRQAARDFGYLVQFQVLHQTQEQIRHQAGMDEVKAVGKAIHRAADSAGLTLRKGPPTSK